MKSSSNTSRQLQDRQAEQKKCNPAHARLASEHASLHAELQSKHIQLGDFAAQPPIACARLHDCFKFQDAAAVESAGLSVALDAMAGMDQLFLIAERCMHCNV